MPKWTNADLNAYEARRSMCEDVRRLSTPDAVDDESELHAAILQECNRRGWLAFHGSMAHVAMRTKGEPDFQILCDGGKLLLIEAKTRTGKLSTEQLGIQSWAKKLGHHVHVVRSIEQFMEICK